jgi:hypothetical protein
MYRRQSPSCSLVKLLYAAVIRAAGRWRGLTVGEFEQRQLKVIREHLNRAHAERTRPAVRPISSASPLRLSSLPRDSLRQTPWLEA